MSQGVRASLRGHHEKMQPLFAIQSRQNTAGGQGIHDGLHMFQVRALLDDLEY